MAKKKLDWKKLALYGGGALLVLWLLRKPASATAVAFKAKAKTDAKMMLGEPVLNRFFEDTVGGRRACFDVRADEYVETINCDRQLTAPYSDKYYWSKF